DLDQPSGARTERLHARSGRAVHVAADGGGHRLADGDDPARPRERPRVRGRVPHVDPSDAPLPAGRHSRVGYRSMDVRVAMVVIDCADPLALSDFWAKATGYSVDHADEEWVTLREAGGGSG